jgi:predicted adenine nucleotide alpha hydrolase (AANH) superfamily ATPase
MEAMLASGIDYTIFFYNPNIHPKREYLLRKNENVRFADKHGVPFIDADYDKDNWLARAKGMDWEPERGARCTMCFDMRFERTALYAHENKFAVMTSSLGISRWKNMAQINECGARAAAPYEGLTYWDFNWRKGGGAERIIAISKREEFYQQEYWQLLTYPVPELGPRVISPLEFGFPRIRGRSPRTGHRIER